MRKTALVPVVLGLFLSLAVGVGAEAATKTQLDVYIVVCVETEGRTWTTGKNGKILHVRGQINREYVYDIQTLELVGEVDEILNYDLNQATGVGGINGSASFLLYDISETDPFIGTAAGHFKSFLPFLRVVAKGTGEIKRVRRKARIVIADPPPFELLLNPYCPFDDPSFGGIFLATGTILDSR